MRASLSLFTNCERYPGHSHFFFHLFIDRDVSAGLLMGALLLQAALETAT